MPDVAGFGEKNEKNPLHADQRAIKHN